jgi:thioredoxin 1
MVVCSQNHPQYLPLIERSNLRYHRTNLRKAQTMPTLYSFVIPLLCFGSLSNVGAFVARPQLPIHGIGPLAAGTIIDLNDSNYAAVLGSNTPVLVDACAPWCGPCKLIGPVLNRCADNWDGALVVARFDVEGKNPDLKMELVLQGVMPKSLPSLILFEKEKAITTRNGVITDDQMEEFLKTNLPTQQKKTSKPKTHKEAGFLSLASSTNDDYMLTNDD